MTTTMMASGSPTLATPVGVGVIGFGKRLQQLTGLLTAAGGPAVRVAHVATGSDGGQAAARALANGPTVDPDYRAMLADPAVQWVLIGSTNDRHREQAGAAMAAGKHVFCEKPVATTIDDCVSLAAAHRGTGLQFVVGFVLRYAPLYRRIVDLVRGGTLGRLVSLEFNETLDFNHGGFIMADWRRHTAASGGHLLEKCSHDVDVVNWIVDSPAARVASFGGRSFFTPENAHHAARLGTDVVGSPAYRTWGGRGGLDPFAGDADIIDNQVVILEYANGVRAGFHTNLNCGLPERRIYLSGTEGSLRADLLQGTIEYRRIGFDEPTRQVDLTDSAGMHGGGDGVMVAELLACMTAGTPTSSPLSTGVAAAVTCLAADEARTAGSVFDLNPIWRRLSTGE